MAVPEDQNSIAEPDRGSAPGTKSAQPMSEEDTWPPDRCWFCESRAAADEANVSIPLGKRAGTQGEIRAMAVTVPRCKHCRHVHRVSRFISWLGGAIFLIAVFGGLILALPRMPAKAGNLAFAGGALGMFILGVALWQLIQFLLSRVLIPNQDETKPQESAKFDYPVVEALRAEGWSEYV